MEASKRFQLINNVTLRVLDRGTGRLIQEQKGHNSATSMLLEGIGHYLAGDGIYHQGYSMLHQFTPKYISLGTMGLRNQDEDSEGLPTGISGSTYTGDPVTDYDNYMNERPGFGSDGYGAIYNNNRPYYGLGPAYTSYSITGSYKAGSLVYYKGVAYTNDEEIYVNPDTGDLNVWQSDKWKIAADQPTCFELITPTFPRQPISFRDVVPEYQAEKPQTIDVIFSAMIPTGAFDEFRDKSKDYIFISEAGLWYQQEFVSGTLNGLLAGYRACPPNSYNQYMNPESMPDCAAIEYLKSQGIENPTDSQIAEAKSPLATQNRRLLQENILRVERNQVVQVIWKIQIGNLENADCCCCK